MKNQFYRVCFEADGVLGSMIVAAKSVEMAISLCAQEVKKKARNCVIDSVNPLFLTQEEESDFLKIVFSSQ